MKKKDILGDGARGFQGRKGEKEKRRKGDEKETTNHPFRPFPASPFSPKKIPAFPSADPSLINPEREVGEEAVSARVVLACTRPDFEFLSRLVEAKKPRYLWNCGVRAGAWAEQDITVAGPVLGAPQAAMVLEKLIALGAKAVVAVGWCGSLQSHLPSGSMVLPLAALAGDGVSPHYCFDDSRLEPHPGLRGYLAQVLLAYLDDTVSVDAGHVWTTDAFYRETADAIQHYQQQDVLAVDLETAAMLAVGRFRKIAVAGLLVVSDELFTLTWQPGHRSGRFAKARELAARAALAAITAWKENDA